VKNFSLLFFLLIALTSCTLGDSTSSGEKSDKQLRGEARTWAVDFNVAGGLAGVRQQLYITSNGTLSATDKKLHRRVERKLQPEQLTEIDGLLARLESAPFPENKLSMPGRCADCVTYQLQAHINDKRISVGLRSGEKMSPTYTDLVSYLSSLLRQTLGRSSNNE